MSAPDALVVGSGLVGASLALGLARAGLSVTLFDAAEDRLHASAGNFGLVWVQGKGAAAPDYARLSRRSAEAWDGFAAGLEEATGMPVGLERRGGLKLALGEGELDALRAAVRRMHNHPDPTDNGTRILSRAEVLDLVPDAGAQVSGGAFGPHDGHADPLATLAALHRALPAAGVRVVRSAAERVEPLRSGFAVYAGGRRHLGARVVLAAGLGSLPLAPALGLRAELRPQRGQVIVTERLPRFLRLPCHTVRQTPDGTVMLGDSHEEVGLDAGTTRPVVRAILARAVRLFPRLARARVMRAWGALRVLSPDGLPLYQASETCPGASLVTCHSGVTLAAAHAGEVARAIAEDRLAEAYPAFGPARLDRAA